MLFKHDQKHDVMLPQEVTSPPWLGGSKSKGHVACGMWPKY